MGEIDVVNALRAERQRRELAEARVAKLEARRAAPIVCLCGSTLFVDLYDEASLQLTLRGIVVLSIGSHKPRSRQYAHNLGGHKANLDRLHKKKIDLADAVLVLDKDGYIGKSTRSEIDHAEDLGRPVISWLAHRGSWAKIASLLHRAAEPAKEGARDGPGAEGVGC